MIRKNKGLTLLEAAGHGISTAQLSRFENGKTMLTLDQFFVCLEQINTTIEEFRYLQKRTWRDQYAHILDTVERLNKEKDVENLLKESQKHFKKSQKTYDWYYFFGCFFENLAILNRKEPMPKLNYIEEIKQFFLKSELWGDMELRVLGMFLFIFDIDTVQLLLKIALKRGKVYREVRGDNRLYYFLLTNCFSTFIYHKRLPEARKVLEQLEFETKGSVDLLLPQVHLLFNKGILKFFEQDKDEAIRYCSQAISVCKIFRQDRLVHLLSKRLAEWQTAENLAEFEELVIELGYLTD
ncbi:helix-turn-helix domain-containing protein [Enterococcus sp. AZ194]|uniref:Rgg/GadR/MutR family transcriptional regulator n=1 Tax=Enterococcus sp. AZ194 TaxID=2774629 RepID=UPI003F686C53